MLYVESMNLLPFMLTGLVNGSLVGLVAVLLVRGLRPGASWLRIRDAAVLGMLGSLLANLIPTHLYSNDGYLAGGPASLSFAVIGAVALVGAVAYIQLSTRATERASAYQSSQG